MRRNVAKRGVKNETICPMCNRLDEDCGHLFFKCKSVKECWRRLNVEEYRRILIECRPGQEVIKKVWSFPEHSQLTIFVLLWRWWSARNKTNAGERKATGAEIFSSVVYHVTDFEKLRYSKNKHRISRTDKWEPPPHNLYKVNVDASFSASGGTGGWGFVARDGDGTFLEGGCGNLLRASNPLHAEALAALHCLEIVAQLGMARIVLETNASELARAVTSMELDRHALGSLFRWIKQLMLSGFDVCHVRSVSRTCNKVADCLAKHGVSNVCSGSTVFMSQAPTFVTNLVSGDLPGANV